MAFVPDYVPVYTCPQCWDEPAGWIQLRCDGQTCARKREHAPHDFCVKCPCWLRRNADLIRKSAEEKIQKGQDASPLFDVLSDLMNGRYRWARAITIAAEHAIAYDARKAERDAVLS